MNLRYYMPTKVYASKGCVGENKAIFKQLGSKALIVTGTHSAKANGSESDVIAALTSVGVDYVIYNKVMTNPTIECCYEGARVAKENGVDLVIAIGGGSPMDAAKGIALLAAQPITPDQLFSGVYGEAILPMVFIPTTAGTGSEVTQYSILTNDEAQTKTSIATDLIFPDVAFLDHTYMDSLGIVTTINTAVDALSHSIEGLLSVKASFVSNALAMESIRLIAETFPVLEQVKSEKEEGIRKGATINPLVREKLLQASMLGGMVIAQTGTTIVHGMGYSLTYFKGIDHGKANGLLLGGYLELVKVKKPELVQRILDCLNMADLQTLDTFLRGLLGEVTPLTQEEITQYTFMASKTKNRGNSIVIPEIEEISDIYSSVFG